MFVPVAFIATAIASATTRESGRTRRAPARHRGPKPMSRSRSSLPRVGGGCSALRSFPSVSSPGRTPAGRTNGNRTRAPAAHRVPGHRSGMHASRARTDRSKCGIPCKWREGRAGNPGDPRSLRVPWPDLGGPGAVGASRSAGPAATCDVPRSRESDDGAGNQPIASCAASNRRRPWPIAVATVCSKISSSGQPGGLQRLDVVIGDGVRAVANLRRDTGPSPPAAWRSGDDGPQFGDVLAHRSKSIAETAELA